MVTTLNTSIILTATHHRNYYPSTSDQSYHTHQKFLSKYGASGPHNPDIPCYTPQTLTYTPYTLILPSNPFHRNHSHLNRQMEGGALKNFRQELWNTKMNYLCFICFITVFFLLYSCFKLQSFVA
jgi:hypothetical protein